MRGLGLYGSKWESSEEAQAGVHCVNFSKNNPATRDWRGRGELEVGKEIEIFVWSYFWSERNE